MPIALQIRFAIRLSRFKDEDNSIKDRESERNGGVFSQLPCGI
jgi:hypothetical protein